MGFRSLISLLSAIRATGLLAFTLAGLSPAEHVSLAWTHNRSWVSFRRGRKPSRGRGERFKRGSATQFDRRNSNGGAVGELRQPFPQPSDHEGETKGILWPGQSVNDRR